MTGDCDPKVRPVRPCAAIALLLLLLAGSVSALSVSAPQSVQEGQPLTLSATGTGTVAISGTATLASGTGSATYTLLTNHTSAGLLTYRFSDASANETRTIEIIDVPLAVTPTLPAKSELATQSVAFALTANWAPELCYVTIDGTSHTLAATNATAFSKTITVAEGIRSVQYKCKLGDELASVGRTIIVDTAAPVVTASGPGGEVTGPYATLTVDTDEIAQCRYGPQDAPYDQLPHQMAQTYALRNTATITIAQQGAQTHFVRCKDVHGNTMQSAAIVSFLGRLAPTARIVIGEEEPLKAGTYKLTLTTNVPLAGTPTLTYALQESGKTQQVGLSGEEDAWTGFIIIPESTPDTVLSFTFEGKSQQGVIGREIERGRIVTIDAQPPKPIDAIAIANDSATIRLTWFVKDPEAGLSYNIYRSEQEGVTYAHLHATTKTTEFADSKALGSRYYYYRVAPVDAAGNIGPLSAEVYGSAVDALIEQPVADPLLLARLDDEIASLGVALLDANQTISALEQEPNPMKVQIIKDMGLVDRARQARLDIERSLSRLRDLRSRAPGRDEVDNAIGQARQDLAQARQNLVTRVVPQEQTETNQITDLAGVERNLPFAIIGTTLSPEEKKQYLQDAAALQERMTVTLSAWVFTLHDRSGAQQEYTFIRKRVSLDDPANDIAIIEVIPKSVAQDVGEIEFGAEPTVLERDPVVQYTFPVLQQEEISYVIRRAVPLEAVKESRTFAYPKVPVPSAPTTPTNQATGFAPLELPKPSTEVALMVLGALLIIGLGLYYASLASDPKPFKGLPPRIEQPVARNTARPQQAPSGTPARIVATPLPQDARTLLEQAEARIDRREYEAAMDPYRTAMERLAADPALQQELREPLLRVYAKLLLHRHLDEAGAAIERKDPAAAKEALAQARQRAVEIGEQPTPLMEDAKHAYERFAKAINTLEIEHAKEY